MWANENAGRGFRGAVRGKGTPGGPAAAAGETRGPAACPGLGRDPLRAGRQSQLGHGPGPAPVLGAA